MTRAWLLQWGQLEDSQLVVDDSVGVAVPENGTCPQPTARIVECQFEGWDGTLVWVPVVIEAHCRTSCPVEKSTLSRPCLHGAMREISCLARLLRILNIEFDKLGGPQAADEDSITANDDGTT